MESSEGVSMEKPNISQSPALVNANKPKTSAPARTAQSSAVLAAHNDDAKLANTSLLSAVLREAVIQDRNDIYDRAPKDDERVVKFSNLETPGAPLEFFYRREGRTIESYHFEHGKIYTLPEEVIAHVETTTARVVYPENEVTGRSLNLVPQQGEPRYAFTTVR